MERDREGDWLPGLKYVQSAGREDTDNCDAGRVPKRSGHTQALPATLLGHLQKLGDFLFDYTRCWVCVERNKRLHDIIKLLTLGSDKLDINICNWRPLFYYSRRNRKLNDHIWFSCRAQLLLSSCGLVSDTSKCSNVLSHLTSVFSALQACMFFLNLSSDPTTVSGLWTDLWLKGAAGFLSINSANWLIKKCLTQRKKLLLKTTIWHFLKNCFLSFLCYPPPD